MPVSSHQIAMMHAQQQQIFTGGMQNAAMISAMMRPSPYMGGFVSGAPPVPPPAGPPNTGMMMPQAGGLMGMAAMLPFAGPGSGVSQGFAEQMVGTGLGALSTVGSGAANIFGGITTGASIAAMIGMGGAPIAALAGAPGTIVGGGLAAGAWGAGQIFEGFQQRQQVNRVLRNRFGGVMGIGGGSGGRGFSSEEMGGISSMVREMAGDDMFTSVEDLTRVMDRTAQMNLYRGVQSARQFRQRFREITDGLREIAEDMHTTLEGATEFYGQQRQMGIFGSDAIDASLRRTRLQASASGMSMAQMQQLGMQGAQMGRAMGMRGRTGARMLQNIATDIGVGMQTGALSDELMSEATGGLQGAEAAQAFSGRMAQVSQRFLNRGAGRVLTAALWDPETGGVNQAMMRRLQSGELDFQQLRTIARRNVAQTGGRRSEFFRDRERITGEVIAEGGGMGIMAALGEHYARRRGVTLDDPIMQRQLRRHLGISQSEVEALVEMQREMPRIQEQRRMRMRQSMQNDARTRAAERSGITGLRRRVDQIFEREVENPFRELGDSLVTSANRLVDEAMDELEGTVRTNIGSVARQAAADRAAGRQQNFLMGAGELQQFRTQLRTQDIRQGWSLAQVGRTFGLRGGTTTDRIRAINPNAPGLDRLGPEGRANLLENMQNELNISRAEAIRLSGGEDQFREIERAVQRSVTSGGAAAGLARQNLWEEAIGAQPGNLRQASLRRFERLQETVPEFARAAELRGGGGVLSEEERIGLVQAFSGRVEGRFALANLGTEGGDISTIVDQEARIASLRHQAAKGIRGQALQGRGRQTRIEAILDVANPLAAGQALLGIARGEGMGDFLNAAHAASTPSARGINELLDVAGEDRALFNALNTFARGEGTAQQNALADLRTLAGAEGPLETGPLAGVELSAAQRRVLGEVTRGGGDTGNQQMREALTAGVDALRGEQSLRVLRRSAQTGTELSRALQSHSGIIAREVGAEVEADLNRIAEMRSSMGQPNGASPEDVQSAEREFLMRHADQPGRLADIATLLESDQFGGAGDYAAIGARRTEQYVRRYRGRGGDGAGAQRARTRRVLEDQLRSAGVTLGQNGLQGDIMRRIRRGEITGEQLVQELRGQRGVQFNLGEGITSTRLARSLQGTLEAAGAGGGLSMGELQRRAAEIGQAGAEEMRIEGAPQEERSLPEIAQRQLDQLERMTRYQEAIARHAGVQQSVLESIRTNTANQGSGGGGETEGGERNSGNG